MVFRQTPFLSKTLPAAWSRFTVKKRSGCGIMINGDFVYFGTDSIGGIYE